jgi:hypothetical protein
LPDEADTKGTLKKSREEVSIKKRGEENKQDY